MMLENHLGMRFRPVPGTPGVLLCIWETRVQDYRKYVEGLKVGKESEAVPWMQETGFHMEGNEAMQSLQAGEWQRVGAVWDRPGWQISEDQPVAGRSWLDAAGFCLWLTWEERKSGRIRADQAYRLPTDQEWSAAAGLAPEMAENPEARTAGWPKAAHFWPWGTTWPAPAGIVNLAREELQDDAAAPRGWTVMPGRDAWPRVAPVEALPMSVTGFYHLTGNVEEWTDTVSASYPGQYVLRGGSWASGTAEGVSVTFRVTDRPVVRLDWRGFRVAFQSTGAEGWRYARER